MVTLCLIGLFALRLDLSEGNVLYFLILVFIGYLFTSWTFLYPQFNLAQVVKRAKEKTLHQIQRESSRLYEEPDELENADIERLKHLMELHEAVSRAPNTMISFSGLRAFIGSLITPTIVAVLGLFCKNLVQKLI